jgi:fatty acyl-CoA reductase
MKIYRKTQKFLAVTTYFRNKQWLFSNNNVQLLWKKLSLEDKILFDFNIAALDWEVYMFYLFRGTRTFIMGEGFENLRSSKQRYVRYI